MTKKKTYFGPDLCPLVQNVGSHIFFVKYLDLSVTRYPGQLSSCTILKKLNDPILRKFRDGRTHGRIDR